MFEQITQSLKKVFGDANARELKKIQPIVAQIASFEAGLQDLSDERLAAKTGEFKQKLENGAPLDDILPEAFAVVREVGRRTMGMRHYDVQMIGGVVLHRGQIAEMKTGEGKTLVGTLPSYLNALTGDGVHMVTVNDYLAKRDAEWMATIYNFLGMDVGSVLSGDRNQANKRAAYAADITYGTNNEFGFDYLRDNMKFDLNDYVQRGHNFCIIDEVDSILIDEARTPLIISGPMRASVDLYQVVDRVIPTLQRDRDFVVDEKGRNVSLTEDGIARIEERLGIDNLYDVANIEVLHHATQSLKAHHLFKRDRDYVVRNGEVVIVDEFTGRLMHGRRWSDGLHQAVEAKERVRVQNESQTYASVTYQNYFRMYEKLSGMTGTAETEAAEFAAIYDLETLVIPTHKPIARRDDEDIVYKDQASKFRRVVTDIQECHGRGQPVLVGTTSVEKSEIVSRMLRRLEIPHEVLNAKNHKREAHIVANAGRLGAVTISTNMAGRGTDIKLGGNPEELALNEVDPTEDPDGFDAVLERWTSDCSAQQAKVLEAGGLHIIGTERHESRRVDNQLRGRAGRQGDVGSSRFYLSLEDDLMRIFGSDKLQVWMERMGMKEDEPIEHRWITRSIENAQKKVEGYNFNIRKNILEYDDVMNYQRKGVYSKRRRALEGEGIEEMLDEAIVQTVDDNLAEFADERLRAEQWQVDKLRGAWKKIFEVEWEQTDEEIRDLSHKEVQDMMLESARNLVQAKREELGDDQFASVARMLLLRIADDLWKDHLLAMDRLRQGVSLRGYGQRNPLLEYKREAFHMFHYMNSMLDEMVLTQLSHASVQTAPPEPAKPAAPSIDIASAVATAQSQMEAPPAPAKPPAKGIEAKEFAEANGIRRNDPCPCGSGLKFKKCCAKATA